MLTKVDETLKILLAHPDPAVRWKTIRNVVEADPSSSAYQQAEKELVDSPTIKKILSDRDDAGQIPFHPYNKWFGAHWNLSLLADLGYPKGDVTLKPMLDQCYDWLLSREHAKYIISINGRVRRCASQEGNCVYYSLALGLADQRTEELVDRLIKWQWPDGGWNCDKKPEAAKSSYHESLIPMRALSLYARISGDSHAYETVKKASELFLKRNLFKRMRDREIIDQNFIQLHYPSYWHYDILSALKVLAEAGFINDPRCSDGLDLLQGKQLADGGYPSEARYYRVDGKKLSGHSRVDWGGISKTHMNPFVTMDVLTVLKKSGRLDL